MPTNWWSTIQSGTITETSTNTLSNKTISGASNTLSNIAKSSISTTGTWVAADIPSLDASKVTTGTVATARLGSGTANSTTFLRGDQSYAVPAGGGGSVDYNIPATAMANVVINGSTITAYEADGTVISTGTTASTVIQAAIDFLPVEVWSLNIMSGTYTITASLDFTGKKKGHCHWGGVTFIANISDAAAYVIHCGMGCAQNTFSGILVIDLATNDKKFGLCIMEDTGSNVFDFLRISGHGTNKATIGIKLGGVGTGQANDDNIFHDVAVHHCTVGIQVAETTGGTNTYHNTFHHINTFGTTTMVQTGRNAFQNEFLSMGLETGTRFLRVAGENNIFSCVYASGGTPIIGDFNDAARDNVVYMYPHVHSLTPPTDTSSSTTTTILYRGKNPNPLAAPATPASGVQHQNTQSFPIDIVVSGGTVTQITFVRNAVDTNLGITSGVIRLEPKDGLKITYSVAPTLTRIPR